MYMQVYIHIEILRRVPEGQAVGLHGEEHHLPIGAELLRGV